jgi:nicotinate-nucleotide adenylyltransferase
MVTDVEFRLPVPSFTIDTMAFLSEKHPEHQFSIIMGEDNLATLHRWKNYEVLIDLYPIWVYPRVDSPAILEELRYHPHVRLVSAPRIELSSTMVRQNIKQGRSVRYMLPEQIHEYVIEEQFYRS